MLFSIYKALARRVYDLHFSMSGLAEHLLNSQLSFPYSP
jgi:hypothetical protein